MGIIVVWLLLSLIVERIVELVLLLIPKLDKKQAAGVDVPVILAFTVALVLSVGAHLNVFEIFGVDYELPLVGTILTTFLLVGGASIVHSLWEWVNTTRKGNKPLL